MPPDQRDELRELARPFPQGFVERKDGQDYVAHHVVNQRLLHVVGPFDFELVEIIRGDIAAVAPDPQGRSRRAKAGTSALRNVIVGGVWRLTVTVDDRIVMVEEVGDVGDVHNWPHDGARLKDAASDAIKRCAMRLGLGLHLWAQEHYFLDRQLAKPEDGGQAEREAAAQPTSAAPADEPPPRADRQPHPPPSMSGRRDTREQAGLPPPDGWGATWAEYTTRVGEMRKRMRILPQSARDDFGAYFESKQLRWDAIPKDEYDRLMAMVIDHEHDQDNPPPAEPGQPLEEVPF
jgi:hypothetical protein